jgi:HEAT repeat protein
MLLALSDSTDPSVRHAALLAVARLDAADRGAAVADDLGAILVRALVGDDASLRDTAIAAATTIAVSEYRRPGAALLVPDSIVDVPTVLRQLAPTGYFPEERARGLLALGPMLRRSATGLVASSAEQAQTLAELLGSGFRSLGEPGPGAELPAEMSRALVALADGVSEAAVPGFAALARHPSGEVRKQAIEFLAPRTDRIARQAVADALRDPDPEVVKTALGALANDREPRTADAIIELLRHASSWALRARAAAALGERDVEPSEPTEGRIDDALAGAARADRYALVREAALRALDRRSAPAARATLTHAAEHDEEPRLRELAHSLLEAP